MHYFLRVDQYGFFMAYDSESSELIGTAENLEVLVDALGTIGYFRLDKAA